MPLSILIIIILNYLNNCLPPFHLVLMDNFLVISFGVCFFVFPSWLPRGVGFYVLGMSARLWHMPKSNPACDWPWATYLELSVIQSLCSPCWAWVCADRTRLHTKVSFFQHWALGDSHYSLRAPRDLPLPAGFLLGLKSESLPVYSSAAGLKYPRTGQSYSCRQGYCFPSG